MREWVRRFLTRSRRGSQLAVEDSHAPSVAPTLSSDRAADSLRYMPALDGVRCFAVLMVAMYHFFIFGAGWIGVQVFFVLSGFLITAILVDSKVRHPANYFRRFYWRRTLRIFPLYYAYFGLAALAFLLFEVPREFERLWPYLLTYTSNFSRMNVYDQGGEYFVHFWSLAVEEQFYLVWPLLVYLLPLRFLKYTVASLLVGVPLLRLVGGYWLTMQGMGPEQMVRVLGVVPLTQLDSFAAGAVLAVFPVRTWGRPQVIAVVSMAIWLLAGAAMLATAPAGESASLDTLGHHATALNYYHVWGITVTNLTAAAVILAAMTDGFRPVLQNRLAIHIGKVSYGVYVLHLPAHDLLNRFVQYRHSSLMGLGIFVVYFAGIVVVATLSYNWFERRFLVLKNRVDRPSSGLTAPEPVTSGPA